MPPIHTHYDNLKVARNAPPEVIRAAYKTLSQKYHPDRNPGNAEAARIMSIINVSYQVLADPEKRREHDLWIAEQEEPDAQQNSKESPQDSPSPSTVRPWVRYWARTIDIYLFSLTGGIFLGFVAPHLVSQKNNEQFLGMLAIFAWIFVESLLLSMFGTTPGKWLLKTKIALASGEPISYSRALARSVKVWWRGLGIGFPIAALITTIVAHGRLTKNGFTSWDKEEGYVVTHEVIGIPRILGAIAFFFVFLIIIAN